MTVGQFSRMKEIYLKEKLQKQDVLMLHFWIILPLLGYDQKSSDIARS